MGLALQSIMILLGMHRERPLEGPVLTLGRKTIVDTTPEQIVNAVAASGLVPVPRELHGTYGTVFDGGTLEHVFDLRTAFSNVAALTAPGGRVLHWSPCNNDVNHGFWQISPRSFYDLFCQWARRTANHDGGVAPRLRSGTNVGCVSVRPAR